MPKTTKKEFEMFKAEVKEAIDNWGLYGWEVSIRHANDPESPNALAVCNADLPGRFSIISLSTTISENEARERIPGSGFHEAAELLLMPLYILASDRFATQDQIDGARHDIIRRLEHAHFKNP
ncbi:MAG TPA: hypothetical protein ENH60_12710 [Pricia sp.]|nr:hypothetical protein [Pricia sp.]